MKLLFALILIALIALSAVAWVIRPKDVEDGKVQLAWVSDDNPVRKEQIDLFNRTDPACHLTLDPANNDMSKVIVQSVGGVGPDLFDCFNAAQLSAYVKSGIAWDLTDE